MASCSSSPAQLAGRWAVIIMVLLLHVPGSECLLCKGWGCISMGLERVTLKPNVSAAYENRRLQVAIVTAGHIRSFAIVAESWHRYLLADPQADIHIFAVASAPLHEACDLMSMGISALRRLVSDMEVSFSSTPETDAEYISSRLNPDDKFSCTKSVSQFATTGHRKVKGNFIDMNIHRSRAYHLARAYGERHHLAWDLVMFSRLDNAYYAPRLSFAHFHELLSERLRRTGERHVIINEGCNHGGYCDRLAIGLPDEMALYFKQDWVFDICNSHTLLKRNPAALERIDTAANAVIQFRCNSESFMKCWLWGYHNITALHVIDEVKFITLRINEAKKYCEMNREEITDKKKQPIAWTDAMSAYFDTTDQRYPEDSIRDTRFRCGGLIADRGVASFANCSSEEHVRRRA